MADWDTRLGTTIEFTPFTKTNLGILYRLFGYIRVLEIVDDPKLSGMGSTETPSLNKLTINSKQGDGDYLFAAKHELGHVMGLTHEHQRADRDTYVFLTNPPTGIFAQLAKDPNYDKYEEKTWVGGWRFKWVGPIPYWYWDSTYKKVQFSVLEGPFDYHSIMLYPSNVSPRSVVSKKQIPAQVDPLNGTIYLGSVDFPGGGFFIQQHTLFITPTDVATVKRLYQ